jgi:hypothetical protein
MKSFCIRFSDGSELVAKYSSLTRAEDANVPALVNDGDFFEVRGLNNISRVTKKAGFWHPIHPGFAFGGYPVANAIIVKDSLFK